MIDDEGREHEMPEDPFSKEENEEQYDLERRYFAFRDKRSEVDLTPEEKVQLRALNIKSKEGIFASMREWVTTKPRPVCCVHCAGAWDRWHHHFDEKNGR